MPRIPKVILLIDTSRESGRNFLKGVANFCNLHTHWIFFLDPALYEKSPSINRKPTWFKAIQADGVIIRDMLEPEKVDSLGLPTIDADSQMKTRFDWPIVIHDPVELGRMGAEHFLERGFRNFAYCGYDDMLFSRERCYYFAKTIAESGYSVHIYKQKRKKSKPLWGNEQPLVVEWLKSLPYPIGLLACNDDRAQQIAQASMIAGLKVPDDIAILGIDNDELICNLSYPPLSSIPLDFERTGYEAAQMLENLMSGEKMNGQKIIVQAKNIITRKSTDVLAIDDFEVAEALRFIRRHCQEPMQVSDVVQITNISRRTLQKKFRQALGHTIYEEISCVRVEKIVQLLTQSNLSIKQIALKIGFSDDKHLSRYFQRSKSITPLAYRRLYKSTPEISPSSTKI